MREQAVQAATSLEDQAPWRAVVTNGTDAMEQRTKAQGMESGVNDRQAQTERQPRAGSRSWSQVGSCQPFRLRFSSVLVRNLRLRVGK